MSHIDIYHNWERLVRAVQKREEYLELARASSSSFSSVSTDFTPSSSLRLPEGDQDYNDILARSDTTVVYSSERELYFHLSDSPILLDGGKLCFGLSKPSGKKCYMLSARELAIVWGSTPLYWQWKNIAESRFGEVAQLLKVCWLEIYGKMQTRMLSANTNYAAYLVFKIRDKSFGLDSSFAKAYVQGRSMAGDNVNIVYLQCPDDVVQNIDAQMPKERRDGWMEIELGEYFVDKGDDGDIVMYFGLTNGYWKSGLIIEGIELRPKHGRNQVIKKSSIPVNMDGKNGFIKNSIPVKIQRGLMGVFIKN